MSLTVIIGPMFSGKSTELINLKTTADRTEAKTMAVNHLSDVRYSKKSEISTHDGKHCEGTVATTHLMDLVDMDAYAEANILFIDEGQFFNDLHMFLHKAVDEDQKKVFVAMLNGNVKRRFFKPTQDALPLADHIILKKAWCSRCNDGTEALFTIRKSGCQSEEIQVGSENYVSVCRRHYWEAVHAA